jgi:hypothetical protein
LSESSAGSDSDSGTNGILGSRISGFLHQWPKRIHLTAPEVDSSPGQTVSPRGAADAVGFMVGNIHFPWSPARVGATSVKQGSLLVVPDPAVACYSTMPYELQPAPPTRPTLHECDMQCSHFRGSSFEPDLLGVGVGLQD